MKRREDKDKAHHYRFPLSSWDTHTACEGRRIVGKSNDCVAQPPGTDGTPLRLPRSLSQVVSSRRTAHTRRQTSSTRKSSSYQTGATQHGSCFARSTGTQGTPPPTSQFLLAVLLEVKKSASQHADVAKPLAKAFDPKRLASSSQLCAAATIRRIRARLPKCPVLCRSGSSTHSGTGGAFPTAEGQRARGSLIAAHALLHQTLRLQRPPAAPCKCLDLLWRPGV